ncbi:hypothetical protein [Candidatus Solincola sp.]|jgi:hypothetical protein|nr:hypothetical protein [Actinomycetota bacterium]MDI7251569.1 hypothetical protein [Actinomycetota bacterium]
MLRVKSRCWRCGEITLALEDIMLVEHGDGDGIFYSFFCPTCGDVQAYPADPRFVDFMHMNGFQSILLPEPIECKREAASPPLTWDDLLDLHLQLESDS